MSEAANNSLEAEIPHADATLAVVVPLFPHAPGLRASLASLNTQTRLPNLVVLLDDGTSAEAETLPEAIPGLSVEIVQPGPGTLSAAVNAAMEYLANFQFIAFLQAGDFYAPTRLERCLTALRPPGEKRGPAAVVTGWRAVDSRGQALPEDDPRVRHQQLLWAPGRAGAGLAEWLGAGHFPGPISNIVLRSADFTRTPLPEEIPTFNQTAVLIAALQGQLTVLHELLLDHYPSAPRRDPTPRQTADALQLQLAVLTALRAKLSVSPETRRNAAAYHRAAWNSLSGVREDLLQQLVLQLAAEAPPGERQEALSVILRSYEAQTAPAHWEALLEGRDPLDLAAYADALRRTRDKLEETRAENERLRVIAEAAQGSGWVRFGAWIGDRAARRVMELEQEEGTPPGPGGIPAEVKDQGAAGPGGPTS